MKLNVDQLRRLIESITNEAYTVYDDDDDKDGGLGDSTMLTNCARALARTPDDFDKTLEMMRYDDANHEYLRYVFDNVERVFNRTWTSPKRPSDQIKELNNIASNLLMNDEDEATQEIGALLKRVIPRDKVTN